MRILGIFRTFEGLFFCLPLQSLCALCIVLQNSMFALCMCSFSIRQRMLLRIDTPWTPEGGGQGGRQAAGLAPPHPPQEKNGYKHRPFWWRTCPLTGEKTQKTGTRKTWQKVAKNGIIQIYNYKNPYIVFVTVERTKLVMYVGG